MAETKTKTRSSTRGSQKSKAKGKPSKPRSRSRPKAKSASKSAPSGGSNGSRAKSALESVEHTAKEAGGTVGKAASKAKLPLVAGGAAIAGAVGGLAVGAHQARRHKGLSGAVPNVKINSRDVAGAAKQVGTFGAQMGRLASELQQAREANGKNRSPLEVVLEGLTARRSRG